MRFRRTLVAGLLVTTTACWSVRPVAAPRRYIVVQQPSLIRVERADNTVFQMNGPRILGDTLVGFVAGEYQEFPLSNIRRVEARQLNKARTALLIGGITAAGVLAFAALHASGESDPNVMMEDNVVRRAVGVRLPF